MTVRRRLTRAAAPLRRRLARRGGWFWLPCPLCGDPFAGFECAVFLSVAAGDGTQAMACRLCETEWSAAAGAVCETEGHDPVAVWRARATTVDGVAGPLRVDPTTEPDEVRCSRCHTRLVDLG